MANPLLDGVTEIFYIGRPDEEKPHCSMERCERFHENHPDKKLVVFLWDAASAAGFKSKLRSPNCEVILWDDDSKLMSWLLDRLATIVGTRILWNRWWACPSGHVTAYDYNTDYTKNAQKCETCGLDVAIVWPDKVDRVDPFVKLFSQVLQLANFDTRSGEYLNRAVSPTANVIRNAAHALGCDHEKPLDLKDAWKGRPVLLCAAGPSLDKAIPQLVRLQYGCAVSCVARAYKKLRAAGVRVDYTVSCEMFEWDSAVFEGLSKDDVGDTILLFASVCAPETVARWPGRKVCMWDVETAKILGRTDWIMGGNSVAHHQLNFAAQILGCEPLILVGNDLAYTEPRTHAEGTTPDTWPEEVKKQEYGFHSEERWLPCTGKGNDFHPQCHRTPVVLGGGVIPSHVIEVRSSAPYQHFANLFAILIAKHQKRVLNACPNGQRIPGAEYVDLAEWSP